MSDIYVSSELQRLVHCSCLSSGIEEQWKLIKHFTYKLIGGLIHFLNISVVFLFVFFVILCVCWSTSLPACCSLQNPSGFWSALQTSERRLASSLLTWLCWPLPACTPGLAWPAHRERGTDCTVQWEVVRHQNEKIVCLWSLKFPKLFRFTGKTFLYKQLLEMVVFSR